MFVSIVSFQIIEENMWFNLKQEIPYYLFKRFVRFFFKTDLITIITIVVVIILNET